MSSTHYSGCYALMGRTGAGQNSPSYSLLTNSLEGERPYPAIVDQADRHGRACGGAASSGRAATK
jgi:hypothetical protein